MHRTIQFLMEGNSDLIKWYSNAIKLWEEIFKKYDPSKASNVGKLASEITYSQGSFERECGTRYNGQEIMAVTSIAMFYTIEVGFDDLDEDKFKNKYQCALNVYNAIQKSMCSIEVKFHAKKVAKSYGLLEDWS